MIPQLLTSALRFFVSPVNKTAINRGFYMRNRVLFRKTAVISDFTLKNFGWAVRCIFPCPLKILGDQELLAAQNLYTLLSPNVDRAVSSH
jgi:hypothetical protein